jgi:hypothetical protein
MVNWPPVGDGAAQWNCSRRNSFLSKRERITQKIAKPLRKTEYEHVFYVYIYTLYHIYIYPSLPKAILNLVFVKKTKLNIAFRGSCQSQTVTVMSCSCCRLQIVQTLTNLDSQESKGLWTIKPLPTRAHFSSANACSHPSVLRSVATW